MNAERWVDLRDVVGERAMEYGLPLISFDNLVELGKRAVNVYGLDNRAKYITFDMICEHINEFINTPFGKNTLKKLLSN